MTGDLPADAPGKVDDLLSTVPVVRRVYSPKPFGVSHSGRRQVHRQEKLLKAFTSTAATQEPVVASRPHRLRLAQGDAQAGPLLNEPLSQQQQRRVTNK